MVDTSLAVPAMSWSGAARLGPYRVIYLRKPVKQGCIPEAASHTGSCTYRKSRQGLNT